MFIQTYRSDCIQKFGQSTETSIFEEWQRRIARRPRMISLDKINLYIHLVQDYKNALKPTDEHLMNLYHQHKNEIEKIQEKIQQVKTIDLKHVLHKWENRNQVKISGFVTCKICKSERAKIQRAQTRSLDEAMTQIVICEQCGSNYPTEQALK